MTHTVSARDYFSGYSIEVLHKILIRSLLRFSVREDMLLPILLLIGKNADAICYMMDYLRNESPSEDDIISMAIELSDHKQVTIS